MIYPNSIIKTFEAEQRIADLLTTNIKNNGLTNIEVNEKAVWVDNNGVELMWKVLMARLFIWVKMYEKRTSFGLMSFSDHIGWTYNVLGRKFEN